MRALDSRYAVEFWRQSDRFCRETISRLDSEGGAWEAVDERANHEVDVVGWRVMEPETFEYLPFGRE